MDSGPGNHKVNGLTPQQAVGPALHAWDTDGGRTDSGHQVGQLLRAVDEAS